MTLKSYLGLVLIILITCDVIVWLRMFRMPAQQRRRQLFAAVIGLVTVAFAISTWLNAMG